MRFALLLRKILFVSLGSMLLLASAHAQQKASALTGINWVPVTGNGPPTTTSCGVTCNSTFVGLPYTDVLNNNTYVYTGTGAVNGFLQTNGSTGGSIPTTPVNALVKINGAAGAASSIIDTGTMISTPETISGGLFISTGNSTLPGGIMMAPNTGIPETLGNNFAIYGFNSSSTTGGYGIQFPETPPTGNQVLAIGALSGGAPVPITYIADSVNVNGSTCTLGGSACLAQGYAANVVTLTGATPAINAANAMQTITLTANATPTVTNIAAGIKGLTIQVCNASGNSFTWTWPAAFHGVSGAITPASGTCNVMVWDSFTGTSLFPEGTGTVNVAP
jgi:hypothetical protein